ncbi:NAD(P)H-hydrate dehydratase [uncultured Roseobacter sp.]|uniref:NAD(P)H-hydrate dehydratase n=1 Tax=uncultured Roseobacter sp. TaxID=114847 RepID=UPI002625A254|nr:NAD(P)H-hydrate dehydratase [uncultured Roseobacter sp.]
MTELLTGAEMRAHETAAIESGVVTGLDLMERAGQGVVDAMFAKWPDMRTGDHSAVVLCGPGDNGGDGFVVARLLKERGWTVDVFCLAAPENLPPDARQNFDRWTDLGPVVSIEELKIDQGFKPDLVVDALFGTGLTRAIESPLDLLFSKINAHAAGGDAKILSVDIPSGVCADSGRVLGDSLRADLTVTFHGEKPGHLLTHGLTAHSKKVVVVDIGLPEHQRCTSDTNFILKNEPVAPYVLRKSGRRHKYDYGHAVVISGPAAHTGAARLAARGALRIGAGLVTVAARAQALPELAAHQTAVMLRQVEGGADLKVQFGDDARANAFCAGPALGTDDVAADLLGAVLALERATVLDADALTLLAERPKLFAALHPSCVLTPHGGEFVRLFPEIAEKFATPPTRGPAYSKVDATRDAARKAGCVVLFKGPDTVIAGPDGRCVINPPDDSAAWLATAGSGDVLAGFICGLLARGLPPLLAAATGTTLHGECARSFGPGLIAEDLPEALPGVFRQMGV